jgi:hypothetical protein
MFNDKKDTDKLPAGKLVSTDLTVHPGSDCQQRKKINSQESHALVR